MAEQVGKKDRREAFAGGAGETLGIEVSRLKHRVQITSEGFDLEDATITVVPFGTEVEHAVAFPADTGTVGVISDFALVKVVVGGLASGSYFVTVSQ